MDLESMFDVTRKEHENLVDELNDLEDHIECEGYDNLEDLQEMILSVREACLEAKHKPLPLSNK